MLKVFKSLLGLRIVIVISGGCASTTNSINGPSVSKSEVTVRLGLDADSAVSAKTIEGRTITERLTFPHGRLLYSNAARIVPAFIDGGAATTCNEKVTVSLFNSSRLIS